MKREAIIPSQEDREDRECKLGLAEWCVIPLLMFVANAFLLYMIASW